MIVRVAVKQAPDHADGECDWGTTGMHQSESGSKPSTLVATSAGDEQKVGVNGGCEVGMTRESEENRTKRVEAVRGKRRMERIDGQEPMG